MSINPNKAKGITPNVYETLARLTVFSPVYEEKAERWRFKLGKEIIYADISGTDIAHDALMRGGALVDDSYQVRLEIETPKAPEGESKKPKYRILEVLKLIPGVPMGQDELRLNEPGRSRRGKCQTCGERGRREILTIPLKNTKSIRLATLTSWTL